MSADWNLFGLGDGGEMPVEIDPNPIAAADGQFVAAPVIDITAPKSVNERLQFFQALVDGARDYGIFMLDPEGFVVSWNAGAVRMKGYSASEVVGKHFSIFHTPEAVSAGHPEYELRMARANGKFEEEGWRVRSDGSLFWATVLIAAVLDKDGTLRGFSKLTRDSTERKRSEERQRENELEIRRLLIDAAAGADGLITLVNTQTEILFGYDRSKIVGRPMEMLVPERFRPNHGGHFRGFFAAPAPRMGVGRELLGLRRDGSEVPVEIGLNSIATADGQFVLASVTDITERKRAQAELQSRAAEMERFTYTVSHDLKSPLITIKSYVAMIDQDLGGGNIDRARADLHRVAKAADKMNQLLEELLSLSRVGRVVNTPEKILFGSLVEEALELVAGGINNGHVHVEVAPDLPSVTVDRRRIVEVLQNLIDNACKFMGSQPEPEIRIGASSDGTETRFYVQDNGVGVEPRHHERIFGLFDKLDPKPGGSGAGLAIVKRIIETHGGRIWIESPGSGGGSTFWFTLEEPRGSAEGKQ